MNRTLLALGLLVSLAAPAAAYQDSPRITNPAIVSTGNNANQADPGVDTTTTGSILPDAGAVKVHPNAQDGSPAAAQSTTFGPGR